MEEISPVRERFAMSPENERFLRQLVEFGRFSTFEAALNAAVGHYREEYDRAVEVLRGKVQEGLDSLEREGARPFDLQKLKERLRQDLEARRSARAAS